jgi:hypothetical protein
MGSAALMQDETMREIFETGERPALDGLANLVTRFPQEVSFVQSRSALQVVSPCNGTVVASVPLSQGECQDLLIIAAQQQKSPLPQT